MEKKAAFRVKKKKRKGASNVKFKATRNKEKRESRSNIRVYNHWHRDSLCVCAGREKPASSCFSFWPITKASHHRSGRYVKFFQLATIGIHWSVFGGTCQEVRKKGKLPNRRPSVLSGAGCDHLQDWTCDNLPGVWTGGLCFG